MYKELDIHIGKKECKAFLQRGFSPELPPTKRMHKHNYADVHIVSGGNMVFYIGNKNHKIEDGTLMIIPREIFHYCVEKEENAIHIAFQVDYHICDIMKYRINPGIIEDFQREIIKAHKTGEYTLIVAFLSLLCSRFCKEDFVSARSITDYGFLIREFFQTGYGKDIKLSELAKVLNVCERQAERLVVQYTGRTFREELAFIRITIAKHLIKTGEMSLQEVAQYVGYGSYAGFWKAMKKYEK
ncbi:MAG: helix-turn-helix transcriptional regulator [Clostridia bacterium]|nr:helix-turn-helix transcriptional regulator [Clostridia bacterium]